MFLKRKTKPERVLFEVTVYAQEQQYETRFDDWTDDLMEHAGNILSAELADIDEIDEEEREALRRRFPTVSLDRPVFLAERMKGSSCAEDPIPDAFCTNELQSMKEFLEIAETVSAPN